MNEQLIKFIEFCLVDGVISDKEREIIFRKSKELGVPDDECEIIINGVEGKLSKKNSIDTNPIEIHPKDNYLNESEHKNWFSKWIESDKSISSLKENSNRIIQEWILNEVNGSTKKGSFKDDPIKEETLLKMCELYYVKDIPDSFWKKGKEGKKGSVESRYSDIIKKILKEERFICYLSSSVFLSMGSETEINWGDKDLNQIIENYYNPNKDLGDGWYKLMTNQYSICTKRKTVLITDKSFIELEEDSKGSDHKINQLNLKDITIDIFSDEFGYFKMIYGSIEDLFRSNNLNINNLIPKYIYHDNKEFIEIIEKIGMNDYTKRLINIDEKIQDFINTKFNSELKKLENLDFYLYGFGMKKSVMGTEKVILKESSLIDSFHNQSLELFNIYMMLLKFRDSTLNLYLSKNKMLLEGVLLKFENSELGMSNFEKTTLSTINSINENIIELKEYTKQGFDKLEDELGSVLEQLNSLNYSNQEVIENLNFSNFLGLVNIYQNYNINKNIKKLN